MRSLNVIELILSAVLALCSTGAYADEGTPITESALKSLYQSAEKVHKIARDLDAEANRHAVLESWNGMFGSAPPSMLFPYTNYSSDAMMPINTPLATDLSPGELLPPRPDIANKRFAQLSDAMNELTTGSQKISIPDKANSDLKVQWSILQQQLVSAQKDQTDIGKIIQDQVIEQEPFMDATKKMLSDANGIDSVLKQVEKHAKHVH
jgi:hypothetical protein